MDGYVVKLNPAGSGLDFATFLGGSQSDVALGMVVDSTGRACVTGGTRSSDFPATPGAFDTSYNGGHDSYVVTLNAAGSGEIYATFLGGIGDEDGYSIAMDGTRGAYVTGFNFGGNFPVTAGAFDPTYNGSTDVVVAKLNTRIAPEGRLVWLPIGLRQR